MTRNYAEKSINAVLNAIANSPAAGGSGGDRVASFYATTLSTLASGSGGERLVFNTRLKQARLLLSLGRLAELRDNLNSLAASMGGGAAGGGSGGGGAGGSGGAFGVAADHSTALLEVYSLQLQLYTQLGDSKRVAELVARAKAVASGAVALPAVYGVMHESSGRCAMQSKRWEEAKVEFLDAFKSYEEAGVSAKAATNLSLYLLAAMLSTSRINPFDDESVRSYKKVPAVEAMVALTESYLLGELRAVAAQINAIGRAQGTDAFIKNYLGLLLRSVQGTCAVELLVPYSQVKVEFVAKELGAWDLRTTARMHHEAPRAPSPH